jgi:hypothetical protein
MLLYGVLVAGLLAIALNTRIKWGPAKGDAPAVSRESSRPADAEGTSRDASAVASITAPPDSLVSQGGVRTPVPVEPRGSAVSLVGYHNDMVKAVSKGLVSQADVMAANVRGYLENFRLAPVGKPPAAGAVRKELAVPGHLLDGDARGRLEELAAAMAAGLAKMYGQYAALLAYVRDDAIQDDGVRGRKIAGELLAAYKGLDEARKDFIGILRDATLRSHDAMVGEHPLRRQIEAGTRFFSLTGEVAALLTPPAVQRDKAALERVASSMAESLDRGRRPPFKGSPEEERLYAAFMDKCRAYREGLAHGVAMGFTSHGKRQLNALMVQARDAYNAFIDAVNSH